MKSYPKIILIVFLFVIALFGSYLYFSSDSSKLISPLNLSQEPKEKPLDKYSFERLKDTDFIGSEIVINDLISELDDYTASVFSFITDDKLVTGQINIPSSPSHANGFPVIIMLRGYVDADTYETGDGTRNAAAYFAENGFVTLAPDFLGYGGSDKEDIDSITTRVKRPVTVLELIRSVETLPDVNSDQIFIWGHSNGGQIALSVLEIIGQSPHWQGRIIPTTLWAPVSKPFPYNILYYTDEYDDRGKALRKVLAKFESDYDTDLYSIHEYYQWISSPIQIHQGTSDDAVPVTWSDELDSALEDLEKDVTYYKYPGADHNLRPAWDSVISRGLAFFRSFLNE